MIPESNNNPNHTKFTDSQWQSISESGSNLLVSASAGSGKTTVLVQRVIEKIVAGANIDELLIVTFTEAAAREMKERIQTAIQKQINQHSATAKEKGLSAEEVQQNRHLIKQVSLMAQANISTIHAFCLQVIRRYYYVIDMDPVFRLLTDTTEKTLLMDDVWEDVREELYGEDDSLFKELTAAYASDRSDLRLTDLLYQLYEFSRANPDPNLWLNRLDSLYLIENEDITSGRVYQEFMKPQLKEILETVIELSANAAKLGEGEERLQKLIDIVSTEHAQYRQIYESLLEDNVEAVYQYVQTMSFDRWSSPRKRKTDDEASFEVLQETANQMKELRETCKDRYQEIQESYFSRPPKEQVQVMLRVSELVREMARITKLFSLAYSERKDVRNVLDFNDLEHLTLQILAHPENKEASHYYREKFQEVMVDEYQDTNQLQENILQWLTHDETKEGNLFMVGDVKQSIYSFRLADPTLFLSKYEKYKEQEDGKRIVLAQNFRSRADVLDFTNFIFQQLMDKSVGQMHYDEAAKLVQGNESFPASPDFQTEILIYESGSEGKVENGTDQSMEQEAMDYRLRLDKTIKGEVMLTGRKIQEMVENQFAIYDKALKTNRPIRYKDIVLLTPTKKNNLVLQEMFKGLGVPLHVNETQNFFQTTEITIMMSLLKIIDNPYQDIPLAAVLRSPIVGMDENELAAIRVTNKTGDYFEALMSFYRTIQKDGSKNDFEEQLYRKLDLLLRRLNNWREKARRESLVTLIWSIYEETGFLDYVGGLRTGRQRKANLHALYERAAGYEQTSFKGLFQFVRFIEKMQEKDKDLAEPTSLSDEEDAVRVMTIHASKGLEFPVVFVMDLSKNINMQDIKGDYVFHAEHGVGAVYKDTEKRIRYHTLPEIVLKTEKKKQLLSEQMRVLYVALTRAEQKLFLVGEYANEETAWKKWGLVSNHQDTVLPVDIRLGTKSLMDWIGYSIVRHPDSQNKFLSQQVANGEVTKHPARFSVSFYNKELLEENTGQVTEENSEKWLQQLDTVSQRALPDTASSNALKEAISLMEYRYVHEKATRTTSYQSVSEIKRMFEEPEDGQMVKIDLNQPRSQNRYVEEELERPKFMAEMTAPTNAEIGTATHLVMQSIDLSQKPTMESITQFVNDLVSRGVLTEDVAKRIAVGNILRFFDTPFGKQLLLDHQYVKREQPFSLLLDAADLFEDMDGDAKDKVLVHGIVDGYFEYENELVLFDYKTDRVERFGDRAADHMREKYKGQIHLYQSALESIMAKPVKQSFLVLLDTGEVISVS